MNTGGGGKAEGAGGVNDEGISLGCTFGVCGVCGVKSPAVPKVAGGAPAAIPGAAFEGLEAAGPLAGPGGGMLVTPPPGTGTEPLLIWETREDL